MKMEQGQGQAMVQRRDAMPVVAAFVDMCRAAYGADMVDAQLAIAQQAGREHAQVLATEGGRNLGLASPFGQTPPIGTPTGAGREGNSTPVATPAAGLGKSPLVSPKVRG